MSSIKQVPMRFTRRDFVRGVLATPWPLLFTALEPKLASARQGSIPSVRCEEWAQDAADFRAGTAAGLADVIDAGGLELSPGSGSGSYTSPPLQAAFPFNALVVSWQADRGTAGSLALQVRTSDDGLDWGEWLQVEQTADPVPTAERQISSLISARGRHVQWAARLWAVEPGEPPLRVRQVTLSYIDAGAGQTAAEAGTDRLEIGPDAGVAAPSIISRASWRCPEPNSSPRWPPEYQLVEKIVVHHTATTNLYTDGAAEVRTIWQYHASSLGWGDIGYNYLIDRAGLIYQGRYGGDNVIAGHARCFNPGSAGIAIIGDFRTSSAPAAALDSLVRLVAWIAYRRVLHPLGQSYFIDRMLATITSHRELQYCNANGGSCYMVTECPGNALHGQLFSIHPTPAERTWDTYPQYADAWLSHDTPASLAAGQTTTVNLAISNRGRLTWSSGGTHPVHAGYHWYRPDGTVYVQNASDDHRTPFASDVAFGQQAPVKALLTAPLTPGSYVLKWDLVEEGVTWFAAKGVATQDMQVTVALPSLLTDRTSLGFLTDPQTGITPASIAISSSSQGVLHWRAAVDQTWCSLSSAEGDTPSSLTVSIDKSKLAPGTVYNAQLTLTCDGAANSPQRIPIRVAYAVEPVQRTYLPLAR